MMAPSPQKSSTAAGRVAAAVLALSSVLAAAEYDCNAGYSNWQAGWSDGKKAFCCREHAKGCGPYQCNMDQLDTWAGFDAWTPQHRTWCCHNQNVGCPGQEVQHAQGVAPVATATTPTPPVAPVATTPTPKHPQVASLPVQALPPASAANKYVCDLVPDWESSWSPEQKTWCCDKEGNGCSPFDCKQDIATFATTWPQAKRSWCCVHRAVGCTTTTSLPYDCAAGYANWELGWSTGKKQWCCSKYSKACDPYDCQAGLSNAAAGWSVAKKGWCCTSKNLGCTTTTSLPYDCAAGYENWELGWSTGKKQWCCSKYSKACDPYDCRAGLSNAAAGWSEAKKGWCCTNKNLGCATTTSLPYDCAAGYANWEAGWSPDKKTWCCVHEQKACDPFDCTVAVGYAFAKNGWSAEKRNWCCLNRRQGCATTTKLPYDCSNGVSNWENLWSRGKKAFCCAHGGKGCDKYDCDFDLANAKVSWCPERKEYCCAKYGKGCFNDVSSISMKAEQSVAHSADVATSAAKKLAESRSVHVLFFALLAMVSLGMVVGWRRYQGRSPRGCRRAELQMAELLPRDDEQENAAALRRVGLIEEESTDEQHGIVLPAL